MYWFIACLFLGGAICGAAIRLLTFVGVLLGVAAAAIVAGAMHGLGTAASYAIVAIVVLQVGYAAGFVLRAAIRTRQ